MEGDTKLIKDFIPHSLSFKIIRRADFRKYKADPLSVVAALLNGFVKQIEVKERLQKENNAEAMLIQAFMANHMTNALCLASKKNELTSMYP